MKQLPALTFLMLLICLCSWTAQKEQPPQEPLGLTLTAHISGLGNKFEHDLVYVTTTLYNPTNDTIRFVTMSCSYSSFFMTDTSAYSIQMEGKCYKNNATVLSIPPGYKLDQLIYLLPQNPDVIRKVTPRIGMYLQVIKKEELKGDIIIKLYRERKSAPVLWSDPIDLDRLHRKPYK